MTTPDLLLAEIHPASPIATSLIAALDADIAARYPGHPIHGLHAEELEEWNGVFVVALKGGVAAACGALRILDDASGEVKRMFVMPAYRGSGLARAVLAYVEASARKRGLTRLRLETGSGQPEAIRLYESSGYHRIPCYGEFAADPLSRCFEKAL
jgi:GNAT superfamily N-acetyltransferase